MSWADAWPSREDQRATTLAMKLGGRRLVARRHSGVDVGVCGDGYRKIRPSVAGSCLALACGRRRGGGEGVSPPWRRSAGASVMPSCETTPVSQNPDCHLNHRDFTDGHAPVVVPQPLHGLTISALAVGYAKSVLAKYSSSTQFWVPRGVHRSCESLSSRAVSCLSSRGGGAGCTKSLHTSLAACANQDIM